MKKELLSLLRNYFCLFLTVTTLLLSCSKDEDIDTGTKPGDNGNPPNAPTSILEQLSTPRMKACQHSANPSPGLGWSMELT